MTAEKDPRIEAVAKLLFTGPLSQQDLEDWDVDRSDFYYNRRMCLMAAEEVLRGIDEAGEWEYGVEDAANSREQWPVLDKQQQATWINEEPERYRPIRRTKVKMPGPWEPLP